MRNQILLTLSACAVLGGCANAVSYHHSERNSISLEARTSDPQQPVQGVIGVKTRTILVTPGTKGSTTNKGSTGTANGDALSVISDFKLDREVNTESWFNTTKITSVFITGDAAVVAPEQTITAVSGLGHGAIDQSTVKTETLLISIYGALTTLANNQKDQLAANHVKALDALVSELPSTLSSNTYYLLDTGPKLFKEKDGAGVSGLANDFNKVIAYSRLLNSSINDIDGMKLQRDVQFDDNGTSKVIDKAMLDKFNKEKDRLSKERQAFFEKIGNSPVIDAASSYAISLL